MTFDEDFLASLERLVLLARRLARVAPPHRRLRARRAGATGEVADRRAYAPGDDPRAIDWPAFARLGRLLVKLFEAEEPRDVLLLVDASASMGRPSRKLDFALKSAAAAGYLALARHDRVGVAAFADRIISELAPRRGHGQAARILRFLEGIGADGPSVPDAPLREVGSRHGHRALAVIATDGLWPADPARPLAALATAGLDAVLLHVIDPDDRDPPLEGALELVSAESSGRLALAADARFHDAYREAWKDHTRALAHACARAGAAYMATSTSEPIEVALLDLLRTGRLLG